MGSPGERFWLNGSFVDEEKACLPVLDRGLLMGDALYEVIRFYGYRPFLLEEHLARLFREARELDFSVRFDAGVLTEAVGGLVARSGSADGTVYVQWTRGATDRSLAPPDDIEPNVFAFRSPLVKVPARLRKEGAPVITLPDERWRGTSVKSTNLLPSVIARREATRSGAFEAILHRGRGRKARITEGTSSTVFIVSGGVVATPALRELLPGITRQAVIGVARKEGIVVEERTVTLDDLAGADEAFLTATTLEVLGVCSVNGVPVGAAAPGPITARLAGAFRRHRTRHLATVRPLR